MDVDSPAPTGYIPETERLANRLAQLSEGELQQVVRSVEQRRRQTESQKETEGRFHRNQMEQGISDATRPVDFGLVGYDSQELCPDNIEDAMRYQPWHKGQQIQGDAVRDALVFAAKAILRNVPRSPRRTLALQHLINARMDANAAISFGGRF